MKSLYTIEEFNLAKSSDKLFCECYNCKQPFLKTKKSIKDSLNPKRHDTGKFCSRLCKGSSISKRRIVKCKNCNTTFEKKLNETKLYKIYFCSRSCKGIHHNANKKYGNKRSKIEKWIEIQLNNLFPNLEILFNDIKTINSELDIYIPSLKLAFEINGIFHYKPIFGYDKLKQIQVNDFKKLQKCINNNIKLYSINITEQKMFKPETSQNYLNQIINTISNFIVHVV